MRCPLLLLFKDQNILMRPTKSISTIKLQHKKELLKMFSCSYGIIHSTASTTVSQIFKNRYFYVILQTA